MVVIAIDFDGTCVTHEFPKIGKDIGAVPVLRALVEQGHQLVLWTMRSNRKDNTGFSIEVPEIHNGDFLDDAVDWFKIHDIELYGIQTNPTQHEWTTSPKAYCQLYLDDAALGAPLNFDIKVSDRPFFDWAKAKRMLVLNGYLSVKAESQK